jgi:D-alanyl-D-alanine carboxypeptidase
MKEKVFHARWEWWGFVGVWLVVFAIGIAGAFAEYVWQQRSSIPSPTPEVAPTPIPVQVNAHWSVPTVSARSVWIYDRNSQSVLLAKEAQSATAAASLAKLMTALVSRQLYSLDQPVTIGSAAAVLGNRAKFLRRDIFSVRDLLKSMLIFSANDAAQALAAADPQGESHFLQLMNAEAQSLHLANTHFDNSMGLDSSGQYASAADLGRLADVVLRDPFLADTVASSTAMVTEQATHRRDVVYTTNTLLRQSPRIQGMKTGTTELAGENLIIRYVRPAGAPVLMENSQSYATFLRQIQSSSPSAELAAAPTPPPSEPTIPLDIIIVILGSQHRFDEAWQLVKWVDVGAQLAGSIESR